MHGGGDGRRDQVEDLFQFAELAERELNDAAFVQVCV